MICGHHDDQAGFMEAYSRLKQLDPARAELLLHETPDQG
jgi:hypothetical protein